MISRIQYLGAIYLTETRLIQRNFPIDKTHRPQRYDDISRDDDSREFKRNAWRNTEGKSREDGARRKRERERKNGEILYILWNEAARSV